MSNAVWIDARQVPARSGHAPVSEGLEAPRRRLVRMLAVLAALALALLVNKGVFASGVAAYPMYLSKAYTYSFRAWATAGGTDPVIHIWDPVTRC